MKGVPCCVSAPGKVLAVGGYLVTLRPHPGLVFSVNARLYAMIRPVDHVNLEAKEGVFRVVVQSPQFRKSFCYVASFEDASSARGGNGIHIQSQSEARNEFIETALVSTLTAGLGLLGTSDFVALMGSGIVVTVLGDASFYSRQTDAPHSEPKKTGLGSSAALVSSLVGALLSYMGLLDFTASKLDTSKLKLAHNLAQYCHYKAQGKIGSGFDVSSAVFGSQVYIRFSPDVLLSLPAVAKENDKTTVSSPVTPANMVAMLNSPLWNSEVEKLRLPPGMHLLLGDVSVGAKTPGMVAAVDSWRNKLNQEGKLDNTPWSRLIGLNQKAIGCFRRLNTLASEKPETFSSALTLLAALTADQWHNSGSGCHQVVELLLNLRATFFDVRRNLKAMGECSGAAIEPDVQTEICDATMGLPGVVLAGVPGAGGMDALFAVALGSTAQTAIQELWSHSGILPMALEEDHKGLLAHTPAFCEDLAHSLGLSLS